LARVVARLSAHSRINAAYEYYLRAIIERLYLENPVGRAITSYTRRAIVSYILYLDFARDPDDPDGGASYSKIWACCEPRQDCGQRMLKNQLAILRVAGLVRQEHGKIDRRLRLYRPTARVLSNAADWVSRRVGALDQLHPANNYAAQASQGLEFLRHITLAIIPSFVAHNIKIANYEQDFFDLQMQNGGFAIGATIAFSEQFGGPPLHMAQTAQRFGLSVSQVRQVLKFIEQRDLLAPDHSGGSKLNTLFKGFVIRDLALFVRYAIPDCILDEPA